MQPAVLASTSVSCSIRWPDSLLCSATVDVSGCYKRISPECFSTCPFYTVPVTWYTKTPEIFSLILADLSMRNCSWQEYLLKHADLV
jgi:hypothetical protein